MRSNRNGRALLLIDFQRDFLETNGRIPVDQSQVHPALAAAQRAVDVARNESDLIVKIGNELWASDLIGNLIRHHASMKGGAGSAWDRRIDPPGVAYLSKWKASAFCNPELAVLLQAAQIGTVSLAGVYAKACVSATAREAQRRGFAVEVIGDAIACNSDKSRRVALEKLRQLGIRIV